MDNWKERCEALKKGKGRLICRFLDEVAEEGPSMQGSKRGELTILDFSASAIIERKLESLKNEDKPNNLDPWGDPLPF